MRRADLHVLALRIIDFVLNPALQRPVVVRAPRQIRNHNERKKDEQ